MEVTYKTKKLKSQCTIASITQKEFGKEMARKIHQRIGEIIASDSVETLVKYNIGRCHQLYDEHNKRRIRENQYAMDLVHPYRLVFEKKGNEVQIANIISIEDYH